MENIEYDSCNVGNIDELVREMRNSCGKDFDNAVVTIPIAHFEKVIFRAQHEGFRKGLESLVCYKELLQSHHK